jgi:hypothetical protein
VETHNPTEDPRGDEWHDCGTAGDANVTGTDRKSDPTGGGGGAGGGCDLISVRRRGRGGGGGDGGGGDDAGNVGERRLKQSVEGKNVGLGGRCGGGDRKQGGSDGKEKQSERWKSEEGERVCATIEARWIGPILLVLRDCCRQKWHIRFFADRCESAFTDVKLTTMVRLQWSCDVFYAYYVYLNDSPSPVAPTSASGTASSANPCQRLCIDVAHLSKLLGAPTKPTDRVTFRAGPRGARSIEVGSARLAWTQSTPDETPDHAEDMDGSMQDYIENHPTQSRRLDSRRWWSYWRHLPRIGTTLFTQGVGDVGLTSPASGAVTLLYQDGPGTVSAATRATPDIPKSFDNSLLRALRYLSAYEFVTPHLHAQCVKDYPLHIGYNLDDATTTNAHPRLLQSLRLPLLAPLINIVCTYAYSPHVSSSVDAFVAHLVRQ